MNARREYKRRFQAPALPGGQGPACWRRALSRNLRRLDAIERACGWIEELDAVAPRLNDGQLFGSCLAELAAGRNPSETFNDEAPHPILARKQPQKQTWNAAEARPRSRHAAPAITQTAAQQKEAHAAGQPDSLPAPRQSASAAAVARLPHRAGADLMKRLAGGTPNRIPAGQSADRSNRNTSWLDHDKRRAAMPPQSSRFLSEAPAGAAAGTSVEAWTLDQAARRAERKAMLHGALPATHTVEPILRPQWSARIAPPQTSVEFLSRLAGLAEPEHAPANHRKASRSQPGQSPPDRPRSLKWGEPLGAKNAEGASEPLWDHDNHHSSPHASWSLQPVASPDADGSLPPAEARMFIERASAEMMAGKTSPNSSAAITPELPPMTPPPEAGVPILPLAASTVQLGAQLGARAEAIAEEDLDALASRIKLILDEQARRHGIDI